eukprot:scaffold4768_cov412-Prasinococcus_capsulatus_cf.AAC.4
MQWQAPPWNRLATETPTVRLLWWHPPCRGRSPSISRPLDARTTFRTANTWPDSCSRTATASSTTYVRILAWPTAHACVAAGC